MDDTAFIDRLKKRNSDIAAQRREMTNQARGTSDLFAAVMVSLAHLPAHKVAAKSSAQALKRCVETTSGVSRIVRGETTESIIVDIEPDASIDDLARLISILELCPGWTIHLGLLGTKMYNRRHVSYLSYLTETPYCIDRPMATENDYHATAESVARYLASGLGLTR